MNLQRNPIFAYSAIFATVSAVIFSNLYIASQVSSEILDCLEKLKPGGDLTATVDAMAEEGLAPQTVNTALYLLLLRRLPAPSEMPMIAARHPRHALIAIRSGDEFDRQGRRTEAS